MRSAGVCVPGHTRVRGRMGPPRVAELLACSTPELAAFWGRHLSASAGRTLPIRRLEAPERLLINVLMREPGPCNHWA